MRKSALLLVLVLASAPAYGQSSSGSSSSVNISNPASTDSKNRLMTLPAVVAPGLAAAGMETCLGSATGGMSIMGLGLTFGKTTPDDGCSIRLAARQLFAFGFQRAAMALMCQDPRVAEAMTAAGDVCPHRSAEPMPRRRRAEEPNAESQRMAERPAGHIIDLRRNESRASSRVRSRETVLAFFKNPVAATEQEPQRIASALSTDESRWLDRASTAY
jgi:hypothetical protein